MPFVARDGENGGLVDTNTARREVEVLCGAMGLVVFVSQSFCSLGTL